MSDDLTTELPAVEVIPPDPDRLALDRHLRVIEAGYRLAGGALAVAALSLAVELAHGG